MPVPAIVQITPATSHTGFGFGEASSVGVGVRLGMGVAVAVVVGVTLGVFVAVAVGGREGVGVTFRVADAVGVDVIPLVGVRLDSGDVAVGGIVGLRLAPSSSLQDDETTRSAESAQPGRDERRALARSSIFV